MSDIYVDYIQNELLKYTTTIEFDWSLSPKELRDLYKQTDFDSIFQEYPDIEFALADLWPDPNLLTFGREVPGPIIRDIYQPFEKFICGLEYDDTDVQLEKELSNIKSLSQPSKLCRRTLKPGDVIFSCLDCGHDQTCVVCSDCFHKSAHKDHNYKIHSSGGGCCDCGDVEAWKNNPACKDHSLLDRPILTLADFEDKNLRSKRVLEDRATLLEHIKRIPPEIAKRYFLVCQAGLHYAQALLISDERSRICPSTEENFFTVLLNDEFHTYDHVIDALVAVTRCTKLTASVMASTISRDGRCVIASGSYEACRSVKQKIQNWRDAGSRPLKVKVLHGNEMTRQAFAFRFIEWIRRMSQLCDGFRVLTAFTLLGPTDRPIDTARHPGNITLVEHIMLNNTNYWKIVREEWNELLTCTMLSDHSIKEQFARLLTRNYLTLVRDFIVDDHNHSVSILSMTTQVYTVPSLLCMLIEEENALSIVTSTLNDVCKFERRESRSSDFEERTFFNYPGLKRGGYVPYDIDHLISFEPTKWTDQLRTNVIEGVKIFLNLLTDMQGMDPVKRQLGQHLEYEPDWESGISLQSKLTNIISRLVTFCSYDNQVLRFILRETQARLLLKSSFKVGTKELFGHQANCIKYDVATSPVSIHLPLTRFAAALILEVMKQNPSDAIPYDERLVMIINEDQKGAKYSMIDVMEQSLRTEVMIAQFRSRMWRRNGYSLVNQILYFHGAIMRKEMFDRDILLLQETASMREPNEFMIHLINKFQLSTWIECETTREPLVGPRAISFHNDEEIMAQTMSLGEELLQILLTLIGERQLPGVGQVSEEDALQNELIHLLCIGPATRSELTRALYLYDANLDFIKNLADLKRSNDASTGKYELKGEFYDRFNPFFYHYSRHEQSNALAAQLKRKKSIPGALVCCPPPKPVELTRQFRNLNELLKCDIMFVIKSKVLTRSLGFSEGYKECSTKAQIRFMASDLQLDQVLHLIGLGLHEQERYMMDFNYLCAAFKHDLFRLLKECYEKTKRSKDLMMWLIRKIWSLIETLRANCDGSIDQESSQTFESIIDCLRPIVAETDASKQDKRKRNPEMAAKHQQRILAMMRANQNKFMSNPDTKKLIDETESMDAQTTSPEQLDSYQLCILCREFQAIGFDQQQMVLLAYVQRSSVLSKNRDRRIPNYALTPSNQVRYITKSQKSSSTPDTYSFTSDNSWSFDATFMTSDLFFGPHISTCGHAMHHSCWSSFYDAIVKRETSRPNRNSRHVSFELEKHEILCPLCECISNTVIPLLPNYSNFVQRNEEKSRTIFVSNQEILDKSSERLSACLHALRGTVDMFKHIRHIKEVATNASAFQEKYMRLLQPKGINDVLEELGELEGLSLRDFLNSVHGNRLSANECSREMLSLISNLADRIHSVGLDLDKTMTDTHHARVFMMTTWCVSYTIQTAEQVSRAKRSSLFSDSDFSRNRCLPSLLKFVCSSMLTHHSDMMQSLLVRKLRYLLVNEEHLSSSPCCLDLDAFETFVSLFILLQKLYAHLDESGGLISSSKLSTSSSSSPSSPQLPSDSSSTAKSAALHYAWATKALDHEYFRNLLHLIVLLNMLQVTISFHNELTTSKQLADDLGSGSSSGLDKDASISTAERTAMENFYKDIVIASGHPNSKIPEVNDSLILAIRERMLPFLRSCAIFFYNLSDIAPPDELCHKKPQNVDTNLRADKLPMDAESINQEYEAICRYLVLPQSFASLLQSHEARNLIRSWLRHSRVHLLIQSALNREPESEPKKPANRFMESLSSLSSTSSLSAKDTSTSSAGSNTELLPLKLIHQPHAVNRLIELPYEYSELLDKAQELVCTSGFSSTTICLVCGELLCSQCYNCQRDLNNLASNYPEFIEMQQQQQQQQQELRRESEETPAHHSLDIVSFHDGRVGGGRVVVAATTPPTTNANSRWLGALGLEQQSNRRSFTDSSQSPSSLPGSGPIHQQLVGTCTYHAYKCSAGVGIFLRLKHCQIVLLSGRSKGSYMPAPYIDDHGETDFGLIRGNPLHLNSSHYERLQHMWLNHTISEQISRSLEHSNLGNGINWHLH